MRQNMFCYQCEQTAGCSGCTGKAGVCGKNAQVAALQDELTGALIGLARATDGDTLPDETTGKLVIEALFTTMTNVSFDEDSIRRCIQRVRQEKARLVPECSSCSSPCGRNDEYNMANLWQAQEDIRSLKSLILFGIRGIAAYAYHAMVLGYVDEEIYRFLYRALFAVGDEPWDGRTAAPGHGGRQSQSGLHGTAAPCQHGDIRHTSAHRSAALH